jgi:hypothetical protein
VDLQPRERVHSVPEFTVGRQLQLVIVGEFWDISIKEACTTPSLLCCVLSKTHTSMSVLQDGKHCISTDEVIAKEAI